MKFFDIPENHKSGVNLDIDGIAIDSQNRTYTFAVGQCPVFGKTLFISEEGNFLDKVPVHNLNETTFLSDMLSGNVTGFNTNGGLQFPNVENSPYNSWSSPLQKNNILDCSQYVKKFEHLIQHSETNINCSEGTNKGKCLKQSFVYDLKTKMCYILYPVLQIKKPGLNKKVYLYISNKLEKTSHLVYGSTNIRSDWEDVCPVKAIKGVVFGKWEKSKCERLSVNKFTLIEDSSMTCGTKVFISSKNLVSGPHWASQNSITGECGIIREKPNCFVYEKEAFSFTSLGMASTENYDLPPCFEESNNWIIKAKCRDGIEREYTCRNNTWQAQNAISITKCESKETWYNLGGGFTLKGNQKPLLDISEEAKKNEFSNKTEENVHTSVISDSNIQNQRKTEKQNEKLNVKNTEEGETNEQFEQNGKEQAYEQSDQTQNNQKNNQENNKSEKQKQNFLVSSKDVVSTSSEVTVSIMNILKDENILANNSLSTVTNNTKSSANGESAGTSLVFCLLSITAVVMI